MADSLNFREIIANHVKRKQRKPNESSWRGCPELPTADELMKDTPPPRPKEFPQAMGPESVPQQSKEEYLEQQYRAYRYEGIELLRRAINNYRRRKSEDKSSHVYSNARVRGYTFARQGAACRIAFSTEMSQTRVDWFDPDEGRLKVGSLVALSNDHFKSQCLVGVVAARPLFGGLVPDGVKGEDDWTPPRIDIFWARPEDSVWDPAEEMVMIQARSDYYEPVRYAMLGLQHAASEQSRFDKYLVMGHKGDPEHETFDNGDVILFPPSADSFDNSQSSAYLRMTIKELAIVQGPPGTGKTFTSLVALESLVAKHASISPVIISAHTNHALDQLLRECMNADMNIMRLGSRTQDEEIERRTLRNIARDSKFSKHQNFALEKARSGKIRVIEEARDLCFPPGLVSAKTLRDYGIITQEQHDSLTEDDWEVAEEISDERRRPADGVEPGTEDQQQSAEEDLLGRWMAAETEEDRSHLYKPPMNQAEPTPAGPFDQVYGNTLSASDESDFEDIEGPVLRVGTASETKNQKLGGQFVSLHLGLTGSVRGKRGVPWWNNKARQLLKENDDLFEIQPDQRGAVYRYLRQQLVERIAEDVLRRSLKEYKAICEDIEVDQDCGKAEMTKREKIRIIGCTTTGLTKYRGLISALEPRVLLVEEAAETHEPNISSALVPSLEQLVLVGDHQQLAPGVKVKEMEFLLKKSLFERLVDLKVPFSQLKVQRRMAPPIREVVQAFYDNLSDHKVVKNAKERPPVQGVEHRIWWFQHRWPDSRHQTSSINVDEARMIIRLYQYLVQNGLEINQITILSFYKAQVEMIKSMLSKDSFFGRIRAKHAADHQQSNRKKQQQQEQETNQRKASDWDSVVRTVDGFQGEQNEVILLSAVRSCSSSGFVAVENRAVVALSRAKRGMFVFGNEETLLGDQEGRDTWGKVWDVFVKQAMRGESFPITCVQHERVTEIHDVESWSRCKNGGCDLPCEDKHCPQEAQLNLENRLHACHLSCHPQGQRVSCKQLCGRELPCNHKCDRVCGRPCKCAFGCGEPDRKENGPPPLMNPNHHAPAWNLSFRTGGKDNAGTLSEAQQPDTGTAKGFREKFCGLDGGPSQLAPSHPALTPVINETFQRTATHENGTRVVTGTTNYHHGDTLIDTSVPEPEEEDRKEREETTEENKEEEMEEDEDEESDLLIEL